MRGIVFAVVLLFVVGFVIYLRNRRREEREKRDE